ncbi:metal ABC transporter solute-binding protein, Zn/Mn family [Fundidesulfovibrio putealis]|uniref:metal ABC transporter solute-binding protein, Zn/Mn family n=1 Tax=Fundidesulfovibrio putealis TaxID=270496 RepID=UPI0003F7C502|nr:zinc ABC transporter substrate-binding protein [Fundidesulfovibrio putealis]
MKHLQAALALVLILWAGPALAGPLPVMVSVAPQKYVLEKLAGPLVEVSVMVAPGADAHTFEPKPSQMAQAAKARLYFAQGVEFEHAWLPKLAKTNPGMTVVNTLEGIELMPMEEHDDDHGHDKHAKDKNAKDKHEELEMDPHTWTAPSLMKRQAETMAHALGKADPENAQVYNSNLKAFSDELAALDSQIRALLKGVPAGSEFIVFHPAWAYFAREYGLKEVAIESGGKEPSPRKLKELIKHAKETKAKAIFVQPQFSRKTAQTLADAIGAKLVPADDLAPDWNANMLAVAKALADALK